MNIFASQFYENLALLREAFQLCLDLYVYNIDISPLEILEGDKLSVIKRTLILQPHVRPQARLRTSLSCHKHNK